MYVVFWFCETVVHQKCTQLVDFASTSEWFLEFMERFSAHGAGVFTLATFKTESMLT